VGILHMHGVGNINHAWYYASFEIHELYQLILPSN